ncbi:10538_t:CDS:2 [Dentiscutata erythropus]|uniref:10538_t:CDS:1 n=1 Tax=Dentiscutata erythropus TaxID=1348616 RepID=A0A9N9ID81_9GLOM|nr:10538_t:CDS:2 [Dentiscutata erythropus]
MDLEEKNDSMNKTFFNDLISNFEYVPENDIEDIESMGLASESLISNKIETGSTTDNILNFDLEINNFCFDEESFERARILAEAEETDNLILLNNMDNDDIDIYGNDILTLSAVSSTSETFINTKTSTKSIDPPSPFFAKLALRLGHVNLVKIIEPKCTITDKTATDLGRALGATTWSARSDVQKNKSKLESP